MSGLFANILVNFTVNVSFFQKTNVVCLVIVR